MSDMSTNIHNYLINVERTAGLTDEQIAAKLGHPIAVVRAVPLPRPQPQRARAVQFMQIEAIQQAFMPKAAAGDMDAANLVLKAQRRQADLLGLDAPKETVSRNFNVDAGNLHHLSTAQLKQMVADRVGLIIEGEAVEAPGTAD